jgi:hypothetical protein
MAGDQSAGRSVTGPDRPRPRSWPARVGGVFASIVLLALSQPAHANEPLLGFYAWAPPTGPGNIDRRSAWLNRRVDLALDFDAGRGWAPEAYGALDWDLAPWGEWIAAAPRRRLLFTLSMIGGAGASVKACADASPADKTSRYYAHFTDAADTLVKYGINRAILRIGHEFTGNWYPWSVLGPDGKPNENYQYYATCYRNIVTIMRGAQPDATWKFDWNPIPATSEGVLADTYPGDAYVDYVTTDPYDLAWPYFTKRCLDKIASAPRPRCEVKAQRARWRLLKANLDRLYGFSIRHKKAFGLSEWGVIDVAHGGGGDDPLYIGRMRAFIAHRRNHVAYQVYFDVSAPDGDHRLYRHHAVYPRSQAAYRRAFGVPRAQAPKASCAGSAAAPGRPRRDGRCG